MPKLPIILFKDTGWFGNQLITHLYVLALAAKTKTPFVNLTLWQYRRYPVGGRLWVYRPWSGEAPALDDPGAESPPGLLRNWLRTRNGSLGRLYRRLYVHDNEDFFTLRVIVERFLASLLRKAFGSKPIRDALSRWYRIQEYRLDDHEFALALPHTLPESATPSRALTIEMEPLIKPYLRIRSVFVEDGLHAVRSSNTNPAMPVMGVHVRRGNYQIYRGGRWWFPDEVYADTTRCLAATFFDGFCRVILVSQAPVESLKKLIPNSEVMTRGLIQDFCTLGACDLIVGPPSTFSGMASYLFNKPLYHIHTPECSQLRPDELRPWQPQWY